MHPDATVRDAVAAALCGTGIDAVPGVSDGGGPAVMETGTAGADALCTVAAATDTTPAGTTTTTTATATVVSPPDAVATAHNIPALPLTQQCQHTLPNFMMEVLKELGARKKWKAGLIGPVYSSDHLDAEDNLNPEAICVRTVSARNVRGRLCAGEG